jgi:putative hemolysin
MSPDLANRLAREGSGYPLLADAIPKGSIRVGRYVLRFARTLRDLEAVQRLRFQVFNLELHEGLQSAYATGRDEDAFDARCHHLMVIAADSNEVVGTYRLMTYTMSLRGGFYSASEFDLSGLPFSVRREAVEVGRACVAEAHRNGRVVQLLWRGLARYLAWNEKRYLFGCCSVPTLDPTEVRVLARELRARDAMHEDIRVVPTPAYACPEAEEGVISETVGMPPLFASYLKLGAKVLSAPAIDREFNVTDFFVLLDLDAIEPHVRRAFFERGAWSEEEQELTIAVA